MKLLVNLFLFLLLGFQCTFIQRKIGKDHMTVQEICPEYGNLSQIPDYAKNDNSTLNVCCFPNIREKEVPLVEATGGLSIKSEMEFKRFYKNYKFFCGDTKPKWFNDNIVIKQIFEKEYTTEVKENLEKCLSNSNFQLKSGNESLKNCAAKNGLYPDEPFTIKILDELSDEYYGRYSRNKIYSDYLDKAIKFLDYSFELLPNFEKALKLVNYGYLTNKKSIFTMYSEKANELDSEAFNKTEISKKYFQILEKDKVLKEKSAACPKYSIYFEELNFCVGSIFGSKEENDCPGKKNEFPIMCSNDHKTCYCLLGGFNEAVQFCNKKGMRLPSVEELRKMKNLRSIFGTRDDGFSFYSNLKKKILSGDPGHVKVSLNQEMAWSLDSGGTVLCVK